MSTKKTSPLRAENDGQVVQLPLGASVIEVPKPDERVNPILKELITAENYKLQPPLRWFVPGWIIEGGTTAIYGEAGAGKSFWALSLALEAARGGQWHQHRFTRPHRVLYLAPEAANSHANRVQGWETLHGAEWPASFHLAPTQVNIYTDESVSDIEQAIDALGPIDLVVLDTLASATAGLDENSPQMNVVTQNLERIRRKLSPGAPLLIVHHTGKDSAKGLRGHSSLLGYVSGSMLITKESNAHKVEAKKVRDGDPPLPLYYRIERAELPPLPGELLAREVGVMVPADYLDVVKDDMSQLYETLAENYRPNDQFSRTDAEHLSGLSRNKATRALNKGCDMGLYERLGNSRSTRYRFIGRPGDQTALEGGSSETES